MLDYQALKAVPLVSSPFAHVIVRNFISKANLARIAADFPALPGPGSHPPQAFALKGHFADLMEELAGAAFRQAVERKFGIDLAGRGYLATIRGELRETDGAVHTDSKSKLITAL